MENTKHRWVARTFFYGRLFKVILNWILLLAIAVVVFVVYCVFFYKKYDDSDLARKTDEVMKKHVFDSTFKARYAYYISLKKNKASEKEHATDITRAKAVKDSIDNVLQAEKKALEAERAQKNLLASLDAESKAKLIELEKVKAERAKLRGETPEKVVEEKPEPKIKKKVSVTAIKRSTGPRPSTPPGEIYKGEKLVTEY